MPELTDTLIRCPNCGEYDVPAGPEARHAQRANRELVAEKQELQRRLEHALKIVHVASRLPEVLRQRDQRAGGVRARRLTDQERDLLWKLEEALEP